MNIFKFLHATIYKIKTKLPIPIAHIYDTYYPIIPIRPIPSWQQCQDRDFLSWFKELFYINFIQKVTICVRKIRRKI